jgi:hypothetical protein
VFFDLPVYAKFFLLARNEERWNWEAQGRRDALAAATDLGPLTS